MKRVPGRRLAAGASKAGIRRASLAAGANSATTIGKRQSFAVGILTVILSGLAGPAFSLGLCVTVYIVSDSTYMAQPSSTINMVSIWVGAENCTSAPVTVNNVTPCETCPDTNCISVAPVACATVWQYGVVGPNCSESILFPGQTAWYLWYFIPAKEGIVDFTVTVTADDGAGGVKGWNTARLFITGALSVTVYTDPRMACQGTDFSVVVDMTNRGATGLSNILPSLVLSPPASTDVAYVSGPFPTWVASLAPGERSMITWVYEAKAPGTVNFTVSLNGSDPSCPGPVFAEDTATVSIRDPLSVTVFVNPTYASAGQPVQVLADAWNCGGMNLTGVAPCIACPGPGCMAVATWPGAAVLQQSGPSPICSAALAPGAHAYFTWQYLAQTGGRVDFTVTMTGLKAGLGTLSSDMDTGTILVQKPPRLSATLYCSYTPAGNVVPYQREFELYMDVFNMGETEAIYTQANIGGIVPSVPSATISLLDCPSLADPCPNSKVPSQQTIGVPGGTSRTFTWLYRADGPGAITISASASAMDGNMNTPIPESNITSLAISIPSPAVLSMTVTGASDAVQGQEIELKVRAMNTSTFRQVCQTAFAVEVRMNGVVVPGGIVSAVAVLEDISDSLLPQYYAPQMDRDFTLRVRLSETVPAQTIELRVFATGFETATSVPVISYAAPLTVRIYTGQSKIGSISPNPYRQSARTGVGVRYVVAPAQAGRTVSLKLYTVSGELVRVLVEGSQSAGVHEALWDGKNSGSQPVASGLYLLVYKAFASGDTRKLAVIK
jgi:hypothetical protein